MFIATVQTASAQTGRGPDNCHGGDLLDEEAHTVILKRF
jgi:hypothetical protein